ncbi:MAG: hypothetical protein ACQCN4_04045, partial [Candidatus Bathyarchaeia archaeon]
MALIADLHGSCQFDAAIIFLWYKKQSQILGGGFLFYVTNRNINPMLRPFTLQHRICVCAGKNFCINATG